MKSYGCTHKASHSPRQHKKEWEAHKHSNKLVAPRSLSAPHPLYFFTLELLRLLNENFPTLDRPPQPRLFCPRRLPARELPDRIRLLPPSALAWSPYTLYPHDPRFPPNDDLVETLNSSGYAQAEPFWEKLGNFDLTSPNLWYIFTIKVDK
jgi:hypothetical protein